MLINTELDTLGQVISQYDLTIMNFTYNKFDFSSGTAWNYSITLDNLALVTILVSLTQNTHK